AHPLRDRRARLARRDDGRDQVNRRTAKGAKRGRSIVAAWLLIAAPAMLAAAVAPAAPSAGGSGGRAVAAAPAGELAADLAAVLERYAPAVVRVEAVLETRLNLGGQGEAQDSRLDLLGAI